MANAKHVAILRDDGPWAWNAWRLAHQNIRPDLSGLDLSDLDIDGAMFAYADLTGCHLLTKNCFNYDFRGTRLRRVDLGNANLSRANLQGADLSQAHLVLTNLFDADLSRSNFTNATLGWTVFGNNDLSSVVGLETVHHVFPSTIGVDTLYRSGGNIPRAFLTGAGVPENLIEYVPALTQQALQFYKCFISFAEPDDEISEKVYSDLQLAGVRCWRWKEDARWGQGLFQAIDAAIRIYDKVIIICSEASLNSPAVIREIERALQKEDELAREGRPSDVLFPLRLDDYVLDGWDHHRRADVRAKYVGDFSHWREPESYRLALARLLRDLHTPAEQEQQ